MMKGWQRYGIPAAAVLLTVAGYLAFQFQIPGDGAEPDMAKVRQEADAGGYRLIDTEALARRLASDPGLLLVDTRQGWEYRTGHIQGAVNFPMEPTWWARWQKRDGLDAFLGGDRDRGIVFY
jgi:hypothetical protein